MAITKLESSRDFFRVWFFWKKQAVLVFSLIVGLTMFYAYTVTPSYESTAKILVLPKTNEGEVISSSTDETRILSVTVNDVYNEAELIISDSVMQDTVESFGDQGISLSNEDKGFFDIIMTPFRAFLNGVLHILRLTPMPSSRVHAEATILKNALVIEPILDSDIIMLSLRGESPARTTDVLQKVLSTYMTHRNNVFTKEDGLSFYGDQATNYREKLDVAENELKEFQKNENIVNIAIQNQANISILTKLTNDLTLLAISYQEGTSRTAILKQNIKANSEILQLTKEMRQIPAIVELEKGIIPVLIRRSELSKTFTKSSREFISINNQINMLRDEIRLEVQKAISTDELELASMKSKIDALKNEIKYIRERANLFNQKEKKLAELKRQVELYKKSFLLYSRKTEDSKIFKEKTRHDLANVTISSQPSLPEQAIFPNRLLMLILSTLAGTFAALCTPFLLESIDNKIKTADDVEQTLGLPVISTFSEIV